MPPWAQWALMEIRVDEVKWGTGPTRQAQEVGPTGRSGLTRGETPPITRWVIVLLAGRRETLDRPDPVGPHRSTEQSVFLGLDVDQVSANIVHPGVEMSRIQPVADGPSGSDRRRRPVGTDEMYAVHDEVRPKYSKMSSPDDSYQPLVTGPLSTNEMNAINDLSRPTAGGPLGRPFSLDPMGPRAMLSLGDGNQPPSVGRPWAPEQPGDQVTEPDYKQTTQTRSESESNTGAPDSVIQTESEVHTGCVNISMANGPTDSSVMPPSSDSVVRSLGERTTQTKSESESVAGIPDLVIQTGSEVQTDRLNISTDNGLTNSRETSPSSDSGVHSWTEHWENMSENSTDSSVYHTVDSHQEVGCLTSNSVRLQIRRMRTIRLFQHGRIVGEEVGRKPVRRDVRQER